MKPGAITLLALSLLIASAVPVDASPEQRASTAQIRKENAQLKRKVAAQNKKITRLKAQVRSLQPRYMSDAAIYRMVEKGYKYLDEDCANGTDKYTASYYDGGGASFESYTFDHDIGC